MDEFETAPGRRTVLKKYGLTQIDFEVMYEAQGGMCAICERKSIRKSFCVDHDHTTGKVRGLLCGECNIGLGKFKDNLDLLKKAVEYLENANGPVPAEVG